MDHDVVAERFLEVDHGGEDVVLDVDQVERVMRDRVVHSQDGTHAVADVGHLADSQRIVRRVLHVICDRPRARHGGRPRIGQISAAVDAMDAVKRNSSRHVD